MTPAFPSLVIRSHDLHPKGSFAEAQAAFLRPDRSVGQALDTLCEQTATGIVAHFYMDVELQSALSSMNWPHVRIADSLLMADAAVEMARAGMRTIAVLGVDFMSENVRAVLDAAGFGHVDVFRLSSAAIGCSLAEAADAPVYQQWLQKAAQSERALHVVYINTSLLTKARAQHIIPTITCTSSNVLKTLLQADAQIPGVELYYGPDTYMGRNLHAMLQELSKLPAAAVSSLHPQHTPESLTALAERLHVFPQGACVVHELFGDDVVRRVQREHADALMTAHLEVPGEMFSVAAKAQALGRGVVGSTSNILEFITDEVRRRAHSPNPQSIPVVLGTESGMITSIVQRVQEALRHQNRNDLDVEIIFPVANEAVSQTSSGDWVAVPGVPGGEGCSTAGGCATCPFMKTNTLERLFEVLRAVQSKRLDALATWRPRTYDDKIDGRSVSDLGSEPILAMRHFQRTGQLADGLVQAVTS